MPTTPIKILLVEDEETVRESLLMLLETMGYILLGAENGLVAWQAIPEFNPDIILTDLSMPVMTGIQLLEKISTEDLQIPVVIISGQGTAEDTINALKLGAYDYITKPILDLDFLTHTLEKAIEKQDLIKIAGNYQELFEKGLKERTYELNQKITQLKEAEDRILQAKQDWESTVDSIPELVALYNTDHELIRLNKSMADFFDLEIKQAQDTSLCIFNDNCPNNIECPHFRVFSTGIPEKVEHHHLESERTFESQIIPYTRGNETVGTILLARDISDIKHAQKAHEMLQARLLQAQKLESVGQLASGIAHEINTPAQYVTSNLEFLREAYEDISELLISIKTVVEQDDSACSKKIATLLEDADIDYLKEEIPTAITQSSEGAERIRSIVLAMKEFSHPGSKQKENGDINKIINTTIIVARNEWKYVSEVITDLDPNLPSVECLTDEIGQVILNLLVNAAQAIGEKIGKTPTGEKGQITITTKLENEHIVVLMEDNGPGIPEKIINNVFDPFFTTKVVGKGTGQGLAIAHDVIQEKHNGTLEVKSQIGCGTIFVIKLPIRPTKQQNIS